MKKSTFLLLSALFVLAISVLASSCAQGGGSGKRAATSLHMYKLQEMDYNVHAVAGHEISEPATPVVLMHRLPAGYIHGDVTRIDDKYYMVIADLSEDHHAYAFDLFESTIDIYNNGKYVGTVKCDTTTELGKLMYKDNR